MKVDIVPIGNSKGIRIPKVLLDQCGFEKDVEMTVEDNCLVLSPTARLRRGWDDAFKAMAAKHEDKILDMPTNDFDESDWQW
jgi:antitoxin MazE